MSDGYENVFPFSVRFDVQIIITFEEKQNRFGSEELLAVGRRLPVQDFKLFVRKGLITSDSNNDRLLRPKQTLHARSLQARLAADHNGHQTGQGT